MKCLVKGVAHIKESIVSKQRAMTSEFEYLTKHICVFGVAYLQGPAKVNGTSRCNCSPVKKNHSESGLRGLAYFQ